MTIKVITPFKYQGSKFKEINNLRGVLNVNSKIIEPFTGTGIVSYTYGAKGSCIGNDFNKDIWNIWVHAKEKNKEYIKIAYELTKPDPTTEEMYDKWRDYYNENYFDTDKFNPERAAIFHYLLSVNFSGNVSYNKKGYNSPFNKYSPQKFHAERIESTLRIAESFAEIYSEDAIQLLKTLEDRVEDFDVIYCDPPYTNSSVKYISQWNDNNLIELDDYLDWVCKNKNIVAVMSNYKTDLDLKGKLASNFVRRRNCNITNTLSEDIILTYGNIENGIEKFFG